MIPENELGVIVLFAQEIADKPIEIVSISEAFPDAIIKHNGIEYRAEFEYTAMNFIRHNHDVRECDLVICWQNDAPEDFILSVWELSNDDWWQAKLTLPNTEQREIAYWKQRALRAERSPITVEVKRSARQSTNKTSGGARVKLQPDEFLEIVRERSGGQAFGELDVLRWTRLGKTSIYKCLSFGVNNGKLERVGRGMYVYINGNYPDIQEEVAN